MKINVVVRIDKPRKDGSYPVSFRFSHRSKTKYAQTGYNVKSVTKAGYIRDKALAIKLDERAAAMEDIFRDDATLDNKPIDEIISCLMGRKAEISFHDDFISYALKVADDMKLEGRQHGSRIRTLANSLYDVYNNRKVYQIIIEK